MIVEFELELEPETERGLEPRHSHIRIEKVLEGMSGTLMVKPSLDSGRVYSVFASHLLPVLVHTHLRARG